MFRKINNNQQSQTKDEKVRQEAKLEGELNSVQPMGNEAANDELMKLNDSDYLNSSHNIVNEDWLERISRKNGKAGTDLDNRINNELDEISDDEDSDHIISTSSKPKVKKNKKKPDQKDAELALEIAEDILEDAPKKKAPKLKEEFDPLSTYAEDADLAAVSGRKKGRRKKGIKDEENAVVPPGGGVDNVKGIEDARWKDAAIKRLMKADYMPTDPKNREALLADEMEKIKNWDFKPVKMDKIQEKPGKFRKFLTYFAGGMGKLLGKALQILTLGHFWRAKSMARFAFTNTDKWQTKKEYQTIPGWDGAKFDPQTNGGEAVLADFRRVPTVWSRLTAAQAAEKVEKDGREEEKPLDPVVSVMVDQAEPGTILAVNGTEMGHTMIGIEYSRKSVISGRYERYKLQYGFYPAGSTVTAISGGMTALKHNARFPGQLKDDYDHKYDISRSYPAKPEQVNAIIGASEKYAEGGYSYFDRNCVTFVKEMIVNKAHLATGGEIFRKSEVDYGHMGNFGIFGSEAFNQNAIAGAENTLMDLMEKEDQTYQNYGNKRATKKDFVNYKNSMKKGGSLTRETYVPGVIGERLRRMEGDEAGEIGSYKFSGRLQVGEGKIEKGLKGIQNEIKRYGSNISDEFIGLLSNGELEYAPNELNDTFNNLNFVGEPLDELEESIKAKLDEHNEGKSDQNKMNRDNIKEEYFVTPDKLRETRAKLSENLNSIIVLLTNYFKNDERFHEPLLNLISLMNFAIGYVDNLYEKTARGGFSELGGDYVLNDVRETMTKSNIQIRAGGKDVSMTPTHYESYIQIYKDPKTAVEKYKRLLDLRKKKKEAGEWRNSALSRMKHMFQTKFNAEDEDEITIAELKELRKLERLDELADDFDQSHNYMIEKNDYSQQDIDYAFRLHNKETTGLQQQNEVQIGQQDINEGVRDKYRSASGIYISIMMDKFFPDLDEQWKKGGDEEGGISNEAADDRPTVFKWMDKYLSDRIKRKKKDFEMIVRGIYRSIKAADPNKIVEEKDVMGKLSDVITQICISRRFENGLDVKENKAYLVLPLAMTEIPKNKSFEFTKLVSEMFSRCDMEDSGLELEIK